MKSNAARLMLAILCAAATHLVTPDRVCAQQSEEAFYRAVETRIEVWRVKMEQTLRELHEQHRANFEKALAGRRKPAGNWFDQLSFEDWREMYFYNMASILVSCAMETGLSADDLFRGHKGYGDIVNREDWQRKYLPCFERRENQMIKFFEIDNSLLASSIDKFESQCEPKARLADRERRLPPYKVLKPSKNVHLRLVAFNVYLKCLTDVAGMSFDPAFFE